MFQKQTREENSTLGSEREMNKINVIIQIQHKMALGVNRNPIPNNNEFNLIHFQSDYLFPGDKIIVQNVRKFLPPFKNDSVWKEFLEATKISPPAYTATQYFPYSKSPLTRNVQLGIVHNRDEKGIEVGNAEFKSYLNNRQLSKDFKYCPNIEDFVRLCSIVYPKGSQVYNNILLPEFMKLEIGEIIDKDHKIILWAEPLRKSEAQKIVKIFEATPNKDFNFVVESHIFSCSLAMLKHKITLIHKKVKFKDDEYLKRIYRECIIVKQMRNLDNKLISEKVLSNSILGNGFIKNIPMAELEKWTDIETKICKDSELNPKQKLGVMSICDPEQLLTIINGAARSGKNFTIAKAIDYLLQFNTDKLIVVVSESNHNAMRLYNELVKKKLNWQEIVLLKMDVFYRGYKAFNEQAFKPLSTIKNHCKDFLTFSEVLDNEVCKKFQQYLNKETEEENILKTLLSARRYIKIIVGTQNQLIKHATVLCQMTELIVIEANKINEITVRCLIEKAKNVRLCIIGDLKISQPYSKQLGIRQSYGLKSIMQTLKKKDLITLNKIYYKITQIGNILNDIIYENKLIIMNDVKKTKMFPFPVKDQPIVLIDAAEFESKRLVAQQLLPILVKIYGSEVTTIVRNSKIKKELNKNFKELKIFTLKEVQSKKSECLLLIIEEDDLMYDEDIIETFSLVEENLIIIGHFEMLLFNNEISNDNFMESNNSNNNNLIASSCVSNNNNLSNNKVEDNNHFGDKNNNNNDNNIIRDKKNNKLLTKKFLIAATKLTEIVGLVYIEFLEKWIRNEVDHYLYKLDKLNYDNKLEEKFSPMELEKIDSTIVEGLINGMFGAEGKLKEVLENVIEEKPLFNQKSSIAEINYEIAELEIIKSSTGTSYGCFYLPEHPLNNHFTRSELFKIMGISYCSSTQFFNRIKANFFGDYQLEKKIMATRDPIEIEELGKKIEMAEYCEEWKYLRIQIMAYGIANKFQQHNYLKEYLRNTGKLRLIQVDLMDSYWASGMSLETLRDDQHNNYIPGKNILGRIFTALRDALTPKEVLVPPENVPIVTLDISDEEDQQELDNADINISVIDMNLVQNDSDNEDMHWSSVFY